MNTQFQPGKLGSTDTALGYIRGFGNEVESEALPGALEPQNSPQRHHLGLAAELVSGSTFTAQRHLNRRSYLFRIRPSTVDARYTLIDNGNFLTPPFVRPVDPNQQGWNQFAVPSAPADFLDGMNTLCGAGSALNGVGMVVHVYLANQSMKDRVFVNADGEMMIIPQAGAIRIVSENGILELDKDEFALVPRGIKFRVELLGKTARGYIIENFGQHFQLPHLGLIGGHGLANQIDFLAPVAAFEDREVPTQLVKKIGGNLWAAELPHSPLDVVAWRGNLTPYKYDMKRFVPLTTATYDHPDPSTYCALTSPSDPVTGANVEFMILNPRWNMAQHTMRPPGFHQNCVTEFAGHLEAPDNGIGAGLNNNFSPHGPPTALYEAARVSDTTGLEKLGGMSFLIETKFPLHVTDFGYNAKERITTFQDRWGGFQKRFKLE